MSSFGLAGISQLALGFVEEWKTIWMWVSWILEPLQVLRRFEGDEGEVLTCLDCFGGMCPEPLHRRHWIAAEDRARGSGALPPAETCPFLALGGSETAVILPVRNDRGLVILSMDRRCSLVTLAFKRNRPRTTEDTEVAQSLGCKDTTRKPTMACCSEQPSLVGWHFGVHRTFLERVGEARTGTQG